MWKPKKFNNKETINIHDRFSDEPSRDARAMAAANRVREAGILTTIAIPNVGEPITSTSYNNFLYDCRFNISNDFRSTKHLIDDFNKSDIDIEKSFRHISNSINVLASNLLESQLGQSVEAEATVIYNSFTRQQDKQYILNDGNLIADPLTYLQFNNEDALTVESGIGLYLPKKEDTDIKVINVTRDHSSSEWGHFLIKEDDPSRLLDGDIYSLVFLNRDRDSLGAAYTRKTSYNVALWFDFGGLSTINKFVIESFSNLKVEKISYIDHNENEVSLDFTPYYTTGNISVVFDVVVAKSLKIILGARSSVDSLSYNSEYGRVYVFSVNSIKFYYLKFNKSGFYLSYPTKISNLVGTRIASKEELSSNSYILEYYICIERKVPGSTSKPKMDVIPIVPNYNSYNNFAVYFLDKKSQLSFYPRQDTFTLYKNGTALISGTDYWFFTNKDSTLQDELPSLSEYGTEVLSIELDTFDAAAIYYCSYIPAPKGKVNGKYSYNQDSIIFPTMSGISNVYILLILRPIVSNSIGYPVISNYSTELYTKV